MRVFYKFWKQLLVKSLLAKIKKKKTTFHSAWTTSHTNICLRCCFSFQNFDVLIKPVAIGSLLYFTPS